MLSKGNVGLLAWLSILSNLETIFSDNLLLKEGIESILLGNYSVLGWCTSGSSYLLLSNIGALNLKGWKQQSLIISQSLWVRLLGVA